MHKIKKLILDRVTRYEALCSRRTTHFHKCALFVTESVDPGYDGLVYTLAERFAFDKLNHYDELLKIKVMGKAINIFLLEDMTEPWEEYQDCHITHNPNVSTPSVEFWTFDINYPPYIENKSFIFNNDSELHSLGSHLLHTQLQKDYEIQQSCSNPPNNAK